MALPVENKQFYTYDAYLDLEEADEEVRYEYFKGEVFAMAGSTASHNLCVYNVTTLMRSHFRPQGCMTFSENIKLEVVASTFYVYPDVMVTCSDRDKENELVKKDPVLIVEVLSKGTEKYDMDIKMAYYQKIPSLQVYIMVSRKDYLLHVLERHADGWSVRAVLGREQQLSLEFFNLTIPVAAIYEDVNLEK